MAATQTATDPFAGWAQVADPTQAAPAPSAPSAPHYTAPGFVAAHPAPDGSGMINMSDADYAKFKASEGQPAAKVPTTDNYGATAGKAIDVHGKADPFAGWAQVADPTQPNPGTSQPSTYGGIVNNFAAGANDTIAQTLGFLPNAANSILNLVPRGINAVAGTHIPLLPTDAGGMIERGMGDIGIPNPQKVPANGEAERMARAAGGAVASLPLMALGGGATEALAPAGSLLGGVGQPVRQMPVLGAALPVATGAAAGQAASDAVPAPYKPYADLAGNLLGGGVTELGQEAAQVPWQLGREALGVMGAPPWLGGGKRVQIGDQAVTPAQAQRATNMLADAAGGPEGLSHALAAEPTAPAGYQDTLAQASGNPGLFQLEQSARTANAAPFLERAKQQNAASVAHIQNVAPTGNPAELGPWFTQQLDGIQAAREGALAPQRAAVAAQTTKAAGFQAPEAVGEAVRGMAADADKARAAHVSGLYDAVDPEGRMGLQVQPLHEAAAQLLGEENPAYGQTMAPEAKQMVALAGQMPPLVRFRDLMGYRQALNDGLSQASRGGDARAARQLSILKSGVDQSISRAIEAKAGAEMAAVASGQLAPEETALAAVQRWQQDWYGRRSAAARSGNGGTDSYGKSGNGLAPSNGVSGAAGKTGRLSSGTSGNSRLPGEVPLEPLDASAAERLAAANAAHAARKDLYGRGPVGAILKAGPSGYGHSVADSDVMRRFFSGAENEGQNVDQLARAIGAGNLAPAAQEYLVGNLRGKGIIRPDGTIDPKAFNVWRQRHAAGIAKVPGLGQKFDSIEAAQRSLDETDAKHLAAIKEYQNGVAKNFLNGDDPIVAIRKAFSSANPTQTFRKLVGAVKGNPDAEAGLKRAVVDFIMHHTVKSADEGKAGFIRSDMFRGWLEKNRGPLKEVFGGQGVNNLDMVAAALRRAAQKTNATGGSDTAPKLLAAKKHGFGMKEGAHLTALAIIGDQLGEAVSHMLGEEGLVGHVAGPLFAGAGYLVHAMRQRGIETINDLVTDALLNPDVARALVERVPPTSKLSTIVQKRIAARLRAVTLNDLQRQTTAQVH